VGDAIVVPYLHRLGMDKLDVLVVTHGHGDHAGGVPPVMEKLRVGSLVFSGAPQAMKNCLNCWSRLTPLFTGLGRDSLYKLMKLWK
jgi:beta-lactamase superfamily II metal-dependent hydrolase